MSLDYILYHVGEAIPIAAAFAVVSAIGYKIRKIIGLTIATGILAGLVVFGMLVQAFGPNLTQQNAAIAVGATAISTVVAFVVVHQVLQSLRQRSNEYGRAALLIGTVASAITGTLVSVCLAMLIIGLPVVPNPNVETLIWSSLLLIGIAGATSEFRSVATTDLRMMEQTGESLAGELRENPPPSKQPSKWNITRRDR